MNPTMIASAIENMESSCHFKGATRLALSLNDMTATVIVDTMIEAQGTAKEKMSGSSL